MNALVWHHVRNLTNNYHDGGGLLVVCEDLVDARLMIKGYVDEIGHNYDADPLCPSALLDNPDLVLPLDETYRQPGIYIFPDKGCC